MTRSRLRPWMVVSAAWIFPAVLGGLNEIAQSTIWGDGKTNTMRGAATEVFVRRNGRWLNTGWQLAPAALTKLAQ